MLNKFCTTLIVSLIFLIIINTGNLYNLNQATGVNVRSCGYVELTGLVRGDSIRDCCDYQVDTSTGKLVPGSLTCKRIFCYDVKANDQGFVRCITLSVISPPAGAPLEELLPGNGTLPPSIEPGDSGTENNTSQNIRKVPKTGILDEPGALSDDESAENDDDTEVRNDLGGPNNDNGPTINPEEE